MRKIVAIGRGGVGKSSFIALLAKLLSSKRGCSILLIDADPDENLAELVGVDLGKMQINTISDVLFNVRYGNINERLKSFSLAEKIEFLINQNALYEGDDFDLISIGTKWTEGCYCQPNNILKNFIVNLERNYDYVLIDSPAGLEHINRRLTSSVDDIFAILDATRKALHHLRRAYRIISEIQIKFNNFYVIGNFRFSDELPEPVNKNTGFQYMGRIEYDRKVEEFNFKGESLFQLEQDSPALLSIGRIISNIGY